MYSESTLGTLTSPLHNDIRARLSLKAPKQLGAIFCIRLLIWPFDRFCHHIHWRCKLGYGYTALKAWRWYNTAQAILASLLASATTTTLNGFVARKLTNQFPNTFETPKAFTTSAEEGFPFSSNALGDALHKCVTLVFSELSRLACIPSFGKLRWEVSPHGGGVTSQW